MLDYTECFSYNGKGDMRKNEGICDYLILPRGGNSIKFKKGGGSTVQGQVFLNGWGGGGWHFSYLILSRFIIFAFRKYFTLCKIVLCI